MLDHIADNEILNRKLLDSMDENKQDELQEWVNYILSSEAILQKDYVLKISRLIKTIILHESAKDLVRQKDRERQEFIENYFQGNVNDPRGFDMVFNTKSFTGDLICKIILFVVEEKNFNLCSSMNLGMG